MNQQQYMPIEDCEELFDISLVGACMAHGHKIEGYNKDPKYAPRVGFLFHKNSELEATINQYFSGELRVDPKEFSSILRDLKTRTKTPY